MIRADSMSVDEWESMCTPMHEILASEPLPGSEACKRSGALFLGSWVASVDTELLKCNSIQAIVEVHDSPWGVSPLPTPGMSQPPEDCYNGEEYESRDCQPTRYKVAITDCTEKDVIKPHLQGVVRHIHECLSNGENVLVHCQQGVSRSSAIVIAYLIRERGLTYESALCLVKSKRTCAKPNVGFENTLKEWEEELRTENLHVE